MDLRGKTVVYIGGFGGIGFATCKILAAKGVKHLIVLDLKPNAAHLAELKTLNSRTHFIAFDITSDLSVVRKIFAEILANFRKIDVVINGAGIYRESMMPHTLQVNLYGPINVVVALMELCDKRYGGAGDLTIVNVASVLGLQPLGTAAIYCASKAGLIMFTKACAQFYERSDLTFMALCPGLTDTAILQTNDTFMGAEQRLLEVLAGTPMQTPEQCAANIVKAVEWQRNGSVWILANAQIRLVEHKELWKSGACE